MPPKDEKGPAPTRFEPRLRLARIEFEQLESAAAELEQSMQTIEEDLLPSLSDDDLVEDLAEELGSCKLFLSRLPSIAERFRSAIEAAQGATLQELEAQKALIVRFEKLMATVMPLVERLELATIAYDKAKGAPDN